MRSFDIFIVRGSVSPPLQLRFILSLSWVTPGTDVVRMSSTIAQVWVIESQQLCWVLHRSPGTFCGSNMKLVVK